MSGYPTPREWSPSLVALAHEEGWRLYKVDDGSGNPLVVIASTHTKASLKSDDRVAYYLAKMASQGSAFHRKALRLIKKYNDQEVEYIKSYSSDEAFDDIGEDHSENPPEPETVRESEITF